MKNIDRIADMIKVTLVFMVLYNLVLPITNWVNTTTHLFRMFIYIVLFFNAARLIISFKINDSITCLYIFALYAICGLLTPVSMLINKSSLPILRRVVLDVYQGVGCSKTIGTAMTSLIIFFVGFYVSNVKIISKK